MSKKDIDSLVARLEEAQHAYHNGLPQLMTDDQYDALVDTLTEMAPTHPFLTKVGAPMRYSPQGIGPTSRWACHAGAFFPRPKPE